MCEPFTIAASLLAASTAVSAGGAFYAADQQRKAAKAEAQYRDYQLGVQNKQVAEDAALVEAQAMQAEAERLEEARRTRATNVAFVAGSGVGENRSFLFGIEKANDGQVRNDVADMRLNALVQRGRMADQIGVNKVESQFAFEKSRAIGRQAMTTAAFSTASNALGNAYKLNAYKVG